MKLSGELGEGILPGVLRTLYAELAALKPAEGREGGMLKRLFQARRTGEAE